MALKKQLRADYLARRAALTDEEYARLNTALLNQFKTLDFNNVTHLHIFLPIINRREPDTTLLVAWLQEQYHQIRLVYPKADITTGTISSYLHDEHLVLETSKWEITEPASGTLIEPKEVDMVIIPLLAFDERGYRVGYGKGFYDRFLAQCKPGTRFIGISQFEPVAIIEDVDGFDIKLDACVMPNRVWKNSRHSSPLHKG